MNHISALARDFGSSTYHTPPPCNFNEISNLNLACFYSVMSQILLKGLWRH